MSLFNPIIASLNKQATFFGRYTICLLFGHAVCSTANVAIKVKYQITLRYERLVIFYHKYKNVINILSEHEQNKTCWTFVAVSGVE